MNATGEEKVCSRCRKEKFVSCFWKNKTRSDGYENYCVDCMKNDPQILNTRKKAIQKKTAQKYRAGKLPGWMYS